MKSFVNGALRFTVLLLMVLGGCFILNTWLAPLWSWAWSLLSVILLLIFWKPFQMWIIYDKPIQVHQTIEVHQTITHRRERPGPLELLRLLSSIAETMPGQQPGAGEETLEEALSENSDKNEEA